MRGHSGVGSADSAGCWIALVERAAQKSSVMKMPTQGETCQR